MEVIKSGLSKKTQDLFLKWIEEDRENFEHDVDENIAWNALVEHLMYLEKLTEGLVCE